MFLLCYRGFPFTLLIQSMTSFYQFYYVFVLTVMAFNLLWFLLCVEASYVFFLSESKDSKWSLKSFLILASSTVPLGSRIRFSHFIFFILILLISLIFSWSLERKFLFTTEELSCLLDEAIMDFLHLCHLFLLPQLADDHFD